MEWINSHIINITVFLPLISSFACLCSPNLKISRLISMGGAIGTFLSALHIWYHFKPNSTELQFSQAYDWISPFGIKYFVGVDGLSLLLIVLTSFLIPLVLISLWHIKASQQKTLLALILSLETGILGALVSFDLVLFYIFWEAMLIPMYFMIGVWGGANRIYATTKFVLYTVFGSLLMLIAAIYLYILHFEEFGFYSTNLIDLYKISSLTGSTQKWLFAAFTLAFAIKIPMWPFHTWLPHAHTEAPTAGSVILAGVLLKMGTYGFLRFAIPLFPIAVDFFAPLIISLGVTGIIYGALTAWMQEDAKKMVAYSSVSHLGFVVVGSIIVIEKQLSAEAMTGAIYQMVNHGISTGALFFLVGIIYERRHSRLLADFGGLAAIMPWFTIMLIVATMGSVGLPGTGGFVGEFLILLGTFQGYPAAAIFASLGVLLGAIYMLTLCRRILFGPITHAKNKELKDLNLREHLYLAPLIILILAMGLFPEFFLNKIRPSINHLAKNYSQYRILISREQNSQKTEQKYISYKTDQEEINAINPNN